MTACPKTKPRITVVGDIMLDRYFVGVERLNPEAPGVVIRVDHEDLRPGGAASVAMIVSSLGADVTLAGVIGSDVPGNHLQALLEEHAVRPHLWIAEDRPTTTKNRFIVRGQLRPDRFDCETTSEITSDAVAYLASCLLGDALLVQDYGKGVCTKGLLRSLMARAAESGLPIFVDPALGRDWHDYEGCTLIKANRVETAEALSCDQYIRGHLYIDAFAGAGIHISKRTGEYVPGSPLNALNVVPPFTEYHFIDLDGTKAEHLRQLAGDTPNTYFYNEDCNSILPNKVFARARWSDFRRALCLLDPYALNLDWEVVRTAGQMKSVEIFLNFMVMDMNMNVLWKNPDNVSPSQLDRMDAFWGDRSWRTTLYQRPSGLLRGFEDWEERVTNDEVAAAYQKRLKDVAGFAYVPDPIPMRNTRGAVIYYLFFASPNATGARIVSHIFNKYRDRGAS